MKCPPAKFKLFLTGLVLTVLAISVAFGQADFSIGSIIKDFEFPQRGSDGKLQLTIYGDEATVISRNRIKVRDLKIEIYREGEVETVLTSPTSDYWSREGRLTSGEGVVVEHPTFRLEAGEMNWELAPSRGFFKNNVRLEIKQLEGNDA